MAQLNHLVKKLLNENCRSEMLETYRFVGMLATMQPSYQMLPEFPSPEKVVTIFMLRIYCPQPMLRICL